jgi:hypothetical protein
MLRHLITARALLCLTVAAAGFAAATGSVAARPLAAHSGASAPTGTWKRVLTQADIDRTASFRVEPQGSTPPPPGPMSLAIAKGSFTFTDDSGFSIGQTLRIGGAAFDILAYIAPDKGAFCTADEPQNASYTWKLDGGALVLTAVDDRCADRNSILVGRWTRSAVTRTLTAVQTGVKERKSGLTFTAKLSEAGTAAGNYVVSCRLLSKSTKRADCRATLHLTDGTLVLRGTVDLAKSFRLTIVSGTGAYERAKGSLTTRPQSDTKTLLTLHLA